MIEKSINNLNNKNRKILASKNAFLTLLFQVIYLFITFASRTVFTRVLGVEYLGINGLFSNVIMVLSFFELGIGNAIVFKLYKPLCEDNKNDICMYLSFFKKVYRYIMVVVVIIGIVFIPFLQYIVNSEFSNRDVIIYYLLFLLDTVVSYAYVYKKSILIADQKNYIVEAYLLLCNILTNVFQIIVVYISHAFIPYLIVKICFDFLCNYFTAKRVEKLYPYVKTTVASDSILKDDLIEFKENLKGLFMEKIAATSFGGTDNIFISLFGGVGSVGIVSQYTIVLTGLNAILNKVFGTLTSAVGKLNVESDGTHVENIFRKLYFVNAILYGLIFVELVNLLKFFVINIWFSEEYTLGNIVVILIVLETCLRGMHYPVYMVRSAYGLFSQLRVMAVIGAVTNIILDIAIGRPFGIAGIFIATIISRAFVAIVDVYVIYQFGFMTKATKFLALWIKVMCYSTILTGICYWINGTIIIESKIIKFISSGIIIGFIYIVGAVVMFHRDEEFRYFKSLFFKMKAI